MEKEKDIFGPGGVNKSESGRPKKQGQGPSQCNELGTDVWLCCAFAWNRPIKLSKIPDRVNSHKGPRFSSSCQLRRHKDGKVTCDKEKRAATHKHNAISIEEGGGESNKNASFYF